MERDDADFATFCADFDVFVIQEILQGGVEFKEHYNQDLRAQKMDAGP
jgi:hypothetical protein